MVRIISTLSVAVLVAVMSVSALPHHSSDSGDSGNSGDQGPGNYDPSRLPYFSSPKASSVGKSGATFVFNWRNAPEGTVGIYVRPAKGGPQNEVVEAFASVNARAGNENCQCDRGPYNEACGRVVWDVPDFLPTGKYQALLVQNREPPLGPTYSDYFTIVQNTDDGVDGDNGNDDDDDDDDDGLYGTKQDDGTTGNHGDNTA